MQQQFRDAFGSSWHSSMSNSKGKQPASSPFPTVIVTPPQMDEHEQLIDFLHSDDLRRTTIPSFLYDEKRSSMPTKSIWRSLSSRLPPSIWDSQAAWLVLYFFTNLGLTLFNKLVLVRFPFPYTLTALHALCGSIGGYFMMEFDVFEPRRLNVRETSVLVGFSVLYTVNIAVSNLSLGLVTVPFHQVVRAATPIFVMGLSMLLFRTHFTSKKLISLLPVIAGVGFATFGDYYFTMWGLILTLLGTVLAALKTVFTNILQSPPPANYISSSRQQKGSGGDSLSTSSSSSSSFFGTGNAHSLASTRLQLHPLDILTRMSPLAFIQCVAFAMMSGELERVRAFSAGEMTWGRAGALAANGALAFALNVVSFTANKKVGPLSMTVAANVKQVLTILFAVSLFNLTITPINGLGILLTLLGGAWYASVEYKEKRARRARLPATA